MEQSDRIRKLKRNIRIYFWYKLFQEPLFWGPILILFLNQRAKMSLEELCFMEAVVVIGLAVLEVLTGALADVIGRKKTVVLGTFFSFLCTLGFALVSEPIHAWIANIIWAIGFALCSGADRALFFESIQEVSQENGGDLARKVKKQEGKTLGRKFLLFAVTSLVAGFLAEIDLGLPFLFSIPSVGIAFLGTLFFVEPSPREKFSLKAQRAMIWSGISTVLSKSHLIWIVLFGMFLKAVSKVWFFTYNPYFELVELPLRYFGLIFFALNLVAWFFSEFAYEVEERIGEKGSILLMSACLGIPILLMGVWAIPIFSALVLVQNVTRGIMGPFLFNFLHQHVLDRNRATVDSVSSSLSGLGQAFGLLLFGRLLLKFELQTSLIFLGLFTLFLGIIFYFWYLKIFSKNKFQARDRK